MSTRIKKLIFLQGIALFIFICGNAQDITIAGPGGCGGAAVTGTWTVPCNVTTVTVEIYGGGGGGGGRGGGSDGGFYDSRGGGGGGGGGYVSVTINVTPGSSFNYSIGSGGCGGGGQPDGSDGDNGTNGNSSTFTGTAAGGSSVSLTANGGGRGTGGDGSEGSAGSGGAGGTASGGSTNTTGTAGNNGSGGNGGAGGPGAGPGGNGGNGGGDPGAPGTGGGLLITYTTTTPSAPPLISSTPATCTVAGTSTITNYDPGTSYMFDPLGPFPDATGLIVGMTPGTVYTVVAGFAPCASAPSAPFSNAAASGPPATPTVTTAPPTCSANGVSTITNYGGTLTYTFTPVGPSAGAGGVISGMTPGTNYTVAASDGSCNSGTSASFSISTQLPGPAVPTISSVPASCIADGSSSISNYNASHTYIFSPASPAAGAGGAISGMTTGTSYTVVANDGNCSSASSSSFSNTAQTPPPVTPAITTAPPTCASAGTSTITNYNASLTYVFAPAGPSAGAGGVISGTTPGTNYTVTADDGSCTSAASASFSNAAQLPTPAVPTIVTLPPSCIADGSSAISNYDATLTYAFTPAGPSAGAGGLISGMVTGTSYTVTADDGNCPSAASASFSNGAQGAPPAVPTVVTAAPTCSGDGTATISNYNAALTYIFVPAGPAAGAGGVISGMVTGTNYTAEASDGSCSSGASSSFSISAQLATPVAAISGSLTYCTGGSTTLTASGGTSYTWTDAGGAIIGSNPDVTVTQGTYTVEAADASGCTATATAIVTESTNLTVTITGALTYCEGRNTTLTASGGVSYTWSNGGTTASITVTEGSYTVTATDGGCSGTADADVTETPVAPLDLGGDVTICEDSLLLIDAGSGYAAYDWTSGETTQTISPLNSGSYSVTVTDDNGCTASASVTVVIDPCIVEDTFTIYIPNAFTPNSDRDNETFNVSGTNIAALDMRIFNRWGEQIFVASGLNSSWNGTYKINETELGEAEMGVYAYVVDIGLQSGTTKTYRGIVTLVR